MILKCVARCRCSGKVAQEKVDCLYTRLSSIFTFTFMHLADAFIQSDLHCIQVTVTCFPWESNP